MQAVSPVILMNSTLSCNMKSTDSKFGEGQVWKKNTTGHQQSEEETYTTDINRNFQATLGKTLLEHVEIQLIHDNNVGMMMFTFSVANLHPCIYLYISVIKSALVNFLSM